MYNLISELMIMTLLFLATAYLPCVDHLVAAVPVSEPIILAGLTCAAVLLCCCAACHHIINSQLLVHFAWLLVPFYSSCCYVCVTAGTWSA